MSAVDLIQAAKARHNAYRPGQHPHMTGQVSISVVIPFYRGASLDLTLDALAAAQQNTGRLKEVIIVDDGSPSPLPQQMTTLALKLSDLGVGVKTVRHAENRGRPQARNTGVAYTNPASDLLLFLDQDMIVDSLLLTEGIGLLSLNGPGLVTGFRTTVPRHRLDAPPGARTDDWRRCTRVDENTIDVTVDGCGDTTPRELRLHQETDGFRTLGVGHGRTLGCWDLPSMVVSHSLLATRDLVIQVGGFPEWVQGWGCEDMALGLSAFSAGGAFIMAVADSCSTQVAHAPLSGSASAQWVEFRANHERYRAWAKHAVLEPLNPKTLQPRAQLVLDTSTSSALANQQPAAR